MNIGLDSHLLSCDRSTQRQPLCWCIQSTAAKCFLIWKQPNPALILALTTLYPLAPRPPWSERRPVTAGWAGADPRRLPAHILGLRGGRALRVSPPSLTGSRLPPAPVGALRPLPLPLSSLPARPLPHGPSRSEPRGRCCQACLPPGTSFLLPLVCTALSGHWCTAHFSYCPSPCLE